MTGGLPGRQPPGDARATITTILLVEDNEDNRLIYATYLTHVGYLVLTAADAEAGLALARERRPDVIVMDVGLPGMDGNEATRHLKADPATGHIPVVTLTAHVHRDDRDRAEAAGCDLYLTKPFDPRALALEVGRLLGRPRDQHAI